MQAVTTIGLDIAKSGFNGNKVKRLHALPRCPLSNRCFNCSKVRV